MCHGSRNLIIFQVRGLFFHSCFCSSYSVRSEFPGCLEKLIVSRILLDILNSLKPFYEYILAYISSLLLAYIFRLYMDNKIEYTNIHYLLWNKFIYLFMSGNKIDNVRRWLCIMIIGSVVCCKDKLLGH